MALHLLWRHLRWVLAAAGLPFVLWACTAHPLEAPTPVPEQQTTQYYELNPIRDIDILFLVDNSPSMADKQNNLVKNFPVFMEQLKMIEGGLPNVHIGVVSSDLGAGPTPIVGGCERVAGDRGILQVKPGCKLQAGARFISSLDNGKTNNFDGDISDVFTCMATLGDTGCGFEHQLQATRVALYESTAPDNKGFLRPDAYLGIILLTDEDDCSADINSNLFVDDASFPGTAASFRCAQAGHLCDGKSPPVGPFQAPLASCTSNENGRLIKVSELVASVRGAKPRPDDQILVAAITGYVDDETTSLYQYGVPAGSKSNELDYLPLCAGLNGKATPAVRIKQFVEAFGANGSLHSICADDFRGAMKTIGEKLRAKVGSPCIEAPLLDISSDPGLQAECAVVDRLPSGEEQQLPACGGGKVPCWRLAADDTCTASGYRMDVDRGGSPGPEGAQQGIKCRTCASADDPRCKR